MFSSHGGFLTNKMHQKNNLIKSTHYDETKKGGPDSHIVRANLKENLKLSHGGPSQRQALGTNQWIKALSQAHH